MTGQFFLGLDLAQKRDFTAIVVVERSLPTAASAASSYQSVLSSTPPPKDNHILRVRHLERLRLGVSYPQVLEHVQKLIAARGLGGRCSLIVDATGVGTPFVDWMRRAGLPCPIIPVIFTSGTTSRHHKTEWHVPKRELITGLQIAIERGHVKVSADLAEAPRLAKELMGLRANLRSGGRMTFDNKGEDEHDDLAMALALACWGARSGRSIGYGSQRLPIGV